MSVSNSPVLSGNEHQFDKLRSADAASKVEASLWAVQGWLERHQLAGYEPFDGLASYLRPMTFGSKVGRQVLIQLVKRAPVNLRPWIGIQPARSTKGMGFLARGYLRWHLVRPDNGFHQKANACLGWLRNNCSTGYSGLCWGNHFDYQTRTYYLPAGQPTVVWSALIGHAFVDSFESTRNPRDLEDAVRVCQFILKDLPRFVEAKGTCISYVAHADVRVHNANALAAGFLARVFRHTRDPQLQTTAAQALDYTAGYQNEDGSWFYGQAPNLHWIDNWHTAYVLDSFLDYEVGTDDGRFRPICEKGWDFYFNRFFHADGCPKYYHDALYPIDIQCASQSIETLCRFHPQDERALPAAIRVALWTIENMQDVTGYFHFQSHRRFRNRTACFHWGQATMLSALALLLVRLHRLYSGRL
jgi:hypothetical protein